jgi:hypothetical protein
MIRPADSDIPEFFTMLSTDAVKSPARIPEDLLINRSSLSKPMGY